MAAPPQTPAAHDAATLAWYDAQAQAYASRPQRDEFPELDDFLDGLIDAHGPGAKVLELGCGGGRDAEQMLRRGIDVTPTDGSAGLAAQAQARLGRPVQVLRFEDLDAMDAYDGVWANACLLHVPLAALPGVLGLVHRALKPGGVLRASFKGGEGDGRDSMGRYFNFPTARGLRAAFEAAAPWAELVMERVAGGGYDQVEREWLICTASKAAALGAGS